MRIKKLIAWILMVAMAVTPIMGLPGTVFAGSGFEIDEIVSDPVLRKFIGWAYDSNGDGCIDVYERTCATTLEIPYETVKDLTGLEYFGNLRRIVIKTDIQSLDFTKFYNLEYLTVNGSNVLDEVEIGFNKKLDRVHFNNCNFTKESLGNIEAFSEVTVNGQTWYGITSGNFPDAYLKNRVKIWFDKDNDNVLSESEVSSVKRFANDNGGWAGNIDGLDIFYNLEEIELHYDGKNSGVTTLDFSKFPKLKSLVIIDNYSVEKIKLTKDPILPDYFTSQLSVLRIYSTKETDKGLNIDISDLPNLEILQLSKVCVNNVDLSNSKKLTRVIAEDGHVKNVTLPKTKTLESVDITNTDIESIDLSGCPNLTVADLSFTNLQEIVINNPKLEQLSVEHTGLKSVNISSCTALDWLEIAGTPIKEIDISNCRHILTAYSKGKIYDNLTTTEWGTGETTSYRGFNYVDKSKDENYYLSCDKDVKIITSMSTSTPTPKPTSKPTVKPTVKPTTTPSKTPTKVPTKAPTSNPTSKPTSKPTNKPNSNVSEAGVGGFVERLYTIALNRQSDPNGKADWIEQTRNGATGADVAKGFLFSSEFLNKNMSNEDFVTTLYRIFFDREPDKAGFDTWVNLLKNNASKETVIWGFINSTEWANVCLKYGIASGGTGTPSITIKPNDKVIGFTTRLYTTCLGRDFDPKGLTDWSNALANLELSGSEVAHGFFFSSELTKANLSDEEFVTRLYRTFMNREPDEAGFTMWIEMLSNDSTREDVFQGFAGSNEWATICSDYGILK